MLGAQPRNLGSGHRDSGAWDRRQHRDFQPAERSPAAPVAGAAAGELVLFGQGRNGGRHRRSAEPELAVVSYPGYREFQRKNQVYSDVAAIDSILFTTHGRVAGGASLEKVNVELVSGLTSTHSASRRFWGACCQTWPRTARRSPGRGGQLCVVRLLGGAPSAVGSPVTIGSTVYTLIGVTPPEFSGVTVGQSPDLWVPLAMEKEMSPGWNGLGENLFQSLYIFARRKPGVGSGDSANANLIFQQMVHGMPGRNPRRRFSTRSAGRRSN